MFEPNSAPDSFAPSHCSEPGFDVLDGTTAVLDVLDEEPRILVKNEGMVLVVGIASGMLVEEVNVELEGVVKCSIAGEEMEDDMTVDGESTVEDRPVDEAGIRIAEEDVVVLE